MQVKSRYQWHLEAFHEICSIVIFFIFRPFTRCSWNYWLNNKHFAWPTILDPSTILCLHGLLVFIRCCKKYTHKWLESSLSWLRTIIWLNDVNLTIRMSNFESKSVTSFLFLLFFSIQNCDSLFLSWVRRETASGQRGKAMRGPVSTYKVVSYPLGRPTERIRRIRAPSLGMIATSLMLIGWLFASYF